LKLYEFEGTVTTIPVTIDVKDDHSSYCISDLKVKDTLDSTGQLWYLGGEECFAPEKYTVHSLSSIQDVYTPTPCPKNILVALQERTFRLKTSLYHVQDTQPIKRVVKDIISCLTTEQVQYMSTEHWISKREASGKKGDRAEYDKYCKWLLGERTGNMEIYQQYTFENHKPRPQTVRIKLHEKFLEQEIKPRLYDVFDPIHAILAGPIYLELARIAVLTVPGYCDGVSNPDLKDKINKELDELETR